jgi:uncharacterized protein YqgV (UPF0045/DUF77 family)
MTQKAKTASEEEQEDRRIDEIYKKSIKKLLKKEGLPYAQEAMGKKVEDETLEDVTEMLAEFWAASVRLILEGACLTWIDQYEEEEEDDDDEEDEEENDENKIKQFPKLV